MGVHMGLRNCFSLLLQLFVFNLVFIPSNANAGDTRLLRQPTISDDHIAFVYASDLWVSAMNGENVRRLTSTSAVEVEPHFSPDGETIAFSSNRSGSYAVYLVPVSGGAATRLTWHADDAFVRGWTPDGKGIVFASGRDTAPKSFDRLWTIPKQGGPATLINKQWAHNGAFSPNGRRLVIDRMDRWDVEWRHYRGGQNTPLVILDLNTNEELKIPNKKTIDIEPVWLGNTIYFISDRNWIANVWSYQLDSGQLEQITFFENNDVKQLSTNGSLLVIEQNGYLHTINPRLKQVMQLSISVKGDFPWAEPQWHDVSKSARAPSLSPTGKRAVFQARGEIFTVPVENGDVRNLSESSDAADRKPIWSPNGDKVAWFSDQGGQGYQLVLQGQDGLSPQQKISIGESKMAWEPIFSPDAKYIAFVDDDVRIRVVTIETGDIKTIDNGGTNLERGKNGLAWSADSQWLAYSKAASNNFRQIWVWSVQDHTTQAITNRFADSFSPSWDKAGKHLFFLASTDFGLDSGWANTSAIGAKPKYAAYIINLTEDDSSPFAPKSDEEPAAKNNQDADAKTKDSDKHKPEEATPVSIAFDNIERRTLALSIPAANYAYTLAGSPGNLFLAERAGSGSKLTVHKYNLDKNKTSLFTKGVTDVSISFDAKHMLVKSADTWKVLDTSKQKSGDGKSLKVMLQMKLDRSQEWQQIFDEAWRYQQDYFYDPNMHGRDWNDVRNRYQPLVQHVKHRADLNYLLDMVNGELSVGHSFVSAGDYPKVAKSKAGLLGADLAPDSSHWQIKRIFSAESWNPKLKSPLDQPGLGVSTDDYIVGINGKEISSSDNIYQFLDGTLDTQTVLHVNNEASFEGARQIIVVPIKSERDLRQVAWVEDNRRLVDEMSGGKLAYIWVPNTALNGFVSFTRYFFAQQDKLGAVVDERFNGGGFLDDYMVDLMSRNLRAAITNEVPNGAPIQLPAGIKGPKVLLINELAGSGGDFFPWVFRQQKIGPLIGSTTWGGLVKSSTHYLMIDGGRITAPDNAVFDPAENEWIGENVGIAPDILVYQDAVSLNEGRDPQLERGVKEALDMLGAGRATSPVPPPFSTPAKQMP